MHIANIPTRPIEIAMIGMPRSGSTIMSSLVNSINNAMIVGEPHAMARAHRPERLKHVPTLVETRYGTISISPGYDDILTQLEFYAVQLGVNIVGFKECWVPSVYPIELVESYKNRLTNKVVMVRDPARNYSSIRSLSRSDADMPIDEFVAKFVALVDYGLRDDVGIMLYELFIANPLKALKVATGWDVVGVPELEMYSGGGDLKARGSKNIDRYDYREPYQDSRLVPAQLAYRDAVNKVMGP